MAHALAGAVGPALLVARRPVLLPRGAAAGAAAGGGAEAGRPAARHREAGDQDLRRYGPDAVLRPRGRGRPEVRPHPPPAALLSARGRARADDGAGPPAAGADGAAGPANAPRPLSLLPRLRRRRDRNPLPLPGRSPGDRGPSPQRCGLAPARRAGKLYTHEAVSRGGDYLPAEAAWWRRTDGRTRAIAGAHDPPPDSDPSRGAGRRRDIDA